MSEKGDPQLPMQISEEDGLRFDLFNAQKENLRMKLILLERAERDHADTVTARYGINLATDVLELPTRAIRRGTRQG